MRDPESMSGAAIQDDSPEPSPAASVEDSGQDDVLPKAKPGWMRGGLLWGFIAGLLVMAFITCRGGKSEPQVEGAQAQDEQTWTCSMHPQIQQENPGACSLCGMDLVPLSPDALSHPEGAVILSKRARALASLETTRVVSRPGALRQLELSGRFAANGMLVRTISTPKQGWIDKVLVDAPGRPVVRGDLVARLYVPGVFEAHRDLLDGQKDLVRSQAGSRAHARAKAKMERAKKELRALGASEDALIYMQEDEDAPSRSIPICTPYTGTILERYLSKGAYVLEGAPVYQIADLTALWLLLDVHEKDLPWVSLGDHVEVIVEAEPNHAYQGFVTYLDETVHPERRTATARVHINDASEKIRIGMFARARLTPQSSAEQQGRLVIPASAPLFTGRRAVVYVEKKRGEQLAYEPRTVRLGSRRGDVYPVIAGLSQGERVVTRGAFALDADLQIRQGPSMMAGSDDRHDDPRTLPISLSAPQLESLRGLFYAYLEIQATLAADELARVRHSLRALEPAIHSVDLKENPKAHQRWLASREALLKQLAQFKQGNDIEEMRAVFQELSRVLIRVLARHGNPLPYGLRLAYCPMAFNDTGAYWLQKENAVLNSYFGAKMLRCGEIRQRIASRDHIMVPADLEPAAPGGQP